MILITTGKLPNKVIKTLFEDNFHTVYTKITPNFPVVICKVHTILKNCDALKIGKMICDTDIRKKWDKVMKTLIVIDKINDFTDIIYSEVDKKY